jgi:uncharacterized membrane protein (UPF0127 family)
LVGNSNSKRVYVYNKTRETFVATNASVADSYLSRLIGLLGRTRRWARPGQGLWIVPSYGVHTIGMLFSIDIVFLDRTHHVVHIEEHVRPFRISKVILKADSVLELPPHTVFKTRTHVGDLLEIGPLPVSAKSRSISVPQPADRIEKSRSTVRA